MAEVRAVEQAAPGVLPQGWVLAGRNVTLLRRDSAELTGAVLSPIVFFVGFYLPLRGVMSRLGLDYAQHLLPVIVLQAMLFTAISSAEGLAADVDAGMFRRMRSMPVARVAPVLGRLAADLVRALVTVTVGVAIGYAFGFRFEAGALRAFAFVGLAVLFALVMALGADSLAVRSGGRESVAQALMVPQLLLVMISTGFVPVSGFPSWLRGIARQQPVSRFADAMRDLATGAPSGRAVAICLLWAAGLAAVFGVLLARGLAGRAPGARADSPASATGSSPVGSPAVVIGGSTEAQAEAIAAVAGGPVAGWVAPSERGVGAAWRGGLLQAQRLLRRWSREPIVLAQTLIFPAFLLLVFRAVLGDSITSSTGRDSVYGTVPLTVLVGTVFGSIGTGASLLSERDGGLLARFQVMPVHRASALIGRLLAELARALAATVALTLAGLAVGLRFHQGPLAAVGFLLVPAVLAVGVAALVTAVAVRAASQASLGVLSLLALLMLFFNAGFVPAGEYPGWLRPVVRVVPFSYATDAMRGLADAGPVLVPFLGALAWGAGLVVVFGAAAVRGYRVAAARRG